jgi:hypothetical protein
MKNTGTRNRSRRGLLQAGVGLLAVAGSSEVAAASRGGQDFAQTQKLAQNIVQYQQTPKDGNKCSLCVNWVPPNACKIVDGTINPQGWCVAFAPKSG